MNGVQEVVGSSPTVPTILLKEYMSEPFKNHREHVRVYRSFILTYYSASNPSVQREVSQINNISVGGMSFSATAPIAVGESLNIELKTPFLAEGVLLQGKVLECREKISQLIYEVRLQFDNLSEQAKEVLVKIEKYSPKEES